MAVRGEAELLERMALPTGRLMLRIEAYNALKAMAK